MVGVPSSCALLGGFAIGARVSLLYDNIAPNAKCERVLVLAVCLVDDGGDVADGADDSGISAAAAGSDLLAAANDVIIDVIVVVITVSRRRVVGFQRCTEASSHIQHTVQISRTGPEEPA